MARIVVVDDEPTHRDLVATVLERAGHTVVAVANGRACLEALAEDGADLVVTDIFMPELDGFQLMTAVRSGRIAIPVIGMTGGLRGQIGMFSDVMTLLGARLVLAKPFSPDELLAAVRAALGDGSGRAS